MRLGLLLLVGELTLKLGNGGLLLRDGGLELDNLSLLL